MTVRIIVADTGTVDTDRLADPIRSRLSEVPGIVVLSGVARHPLWRNAHAKVARELDLLVAAGGKPADGLLVLTSLALDVVRAQPLALATRGDARRRAAVAVQIAPGGRGRPERIIVLAVDLTEGEWSRHEQELRQRLAAMGFSREAPVYVAAVGGRLAILVDLMQVQPVTLAEADDFDAGLRSFAIDVVTTER